MLVTWKMENRGVERRKEAGESPMWVGEEGWVKQKKRKRGKEIERKQFKIFTSKEGDSLRTRRT